MRSSIKLSLIAARSQNGVIGKSGKLPWRLADDLAFFKSATEGHPIIMGRKTWDSLPVRPLPKRENIVLTRDWAFRANGARVHTSIRPAIEAGRALARAAGKQEVFVVGGEALYTATIQVADLIYITEVETKVDGDAFFPEFDEAAFEEITRRRVEADDRNQFPFYIRVLKRKA